MADTVAGAITWESLSESQRLALAWAALPANAGRPRWHCSPRIDSRTWSSLVRRGLIEMDQRSWTWTATAVGRALLPIERMEAGDV